MLQWEKKDNNVNVFSTLTFAPPPPHDKVYYILVQSIQVVSR